MVITIPSKSHVFQEKIIMHDSVDWFYGTYLARLVYTYGRKHCLSSRSCVLSRSIHLLNYRESITITPTSDRAVYEYFRELRGKHFNRAISLSR